MNEIPTWRKVIYTIFAPVFIFGWVILHPKLFWQEAKRTWNEPSSCTGDCNQGRNCNCVEK